MPGGYDNPAWVDDLGVYFSSAWHSMDGTTATYQLNTNTLKQSAGPSWDNVVPSSGSSDFDYYNSWDSVCKY